MYVHIKMKRRFIYLIFANMEMFFFSIQNKLYEYILQFMHLWKIEDMYIHGRRKTEKYNWQNNFMSKPVFLCTI